MAPVRLLPTMRRGVPAAVRQVEATDESHGIVDDDDFLVMGGADRVRAVELEANPAMGLPAELETREQFPVGGVQHGEIPVEQADTQRPVAPDEGIEEISQLLRQAVIRTLGHELHAAVQVPAKHMDRMARLAGCCTHRSEIILAIDEKRDTRCLLDAPAVSSRHQQAPGIARLGSRLVRAAGGLAGGAGLAS